MSSATSQSPLPPAARPMRWQRSMGAVLLALWLGMAWQKAAANLLPELCWLCHVSSFALALGLLANWRTLLGIAFLLQWAVAVPVYVVWLLQGGHSQPWSLALHFTAPLFGAMACWHQRLPVHSVRLALASVLLLWLATRFCLPANMNVNFAFQPLVLLPQAGWMNWIADFLLLGGVLAVSQHGWNWLSHLSRQDRVNPPS